MEIQFLNSIKDSAPSVVIECSPEEYTHIRRALFLALLASAGEPKHEAIQQIENKFQLFESRIKFGI